MPALLSRLRPSRWSVASRPATVGVVVVAVAVLLTTGLIVAMVHTDMLRDAQAQIDANLRVAEELLRQKANGTLLQLRGEQLVAGNGYVLDGDFDLVDKVHALLGGSVTLFRGDLRVSTNVHTADGERAIGTRLVPGPV